MPRSNQMPRLTVRRIKRQQALEMIPDAQLQEICKEYFIESKWTGAYHLRKDILDYWCSTEDSSLEVTISEMIRSMIK